MTAAPMRPAQEPGPDDTALWRVPRGSALRLDVGPAERCLRLLAGRLWLTSQGRADAPPDDLWLVAGDAVRLPAGAVLVAEGWPEATFEVVVPPPPPAHATRVGRMGTWWATRFGRVGVPT